MSKKIKFILPALLGVGVVSGLLMSNSEQPIQKKHLIVHGIMPEKEVPQLVADTDVIVVGKVDQINPSMWSNENPYAPVDARAIIQTDIDVNVTDVLKGELNDPEKVVVRIEKGETDDAILTSEGYPDFSENEDVMLFLSRDDGDLATSEDYYVLTGMRQGKFVGNEDSGTYSSDVAEVSVEEIKDLIVEAEEGRIPCSIQMTKEEIYENNKLLFGE